MARNSPSISNSDSSGKHASGDGPSGNGTSGDGSWAEALRDFAPYLDLGWRVAVAAALPPILGFGIDVWLGVRPWGVVSGAAIGLLGALVQLARLGPEMEKRARNS